MDLAMLRARSALLHLKPLVFRFGMPGTPGQVQLNTAITELGWQVADNSPLLVTNGNCPGELDDDIKAVAILEADGKLTAPDGWHVCARKPMKTFATLNAIVSKFCSSFLPHSLLRPVQLLLEKFGISKVVGARRCALNDSDKQLVVLARQGTSISLQPSAADAIRDACMSVCKIGHLPLFGANFASLATVLMAIGAASLAGASALLSTLVILVVLSTVLGVAFENWSEGYYLAEDAREVVLDEVAGMSVTLLFLPADANWLWFAVAFVLFRFFDIFKFGIHWIEETNWPGTIVWDDLLAGLYAGLVLMLLGWIF